MYHSEGLVIAPERRKSSKFVWLATACALAAACGECGARNVGVAAEKPTEKAAQASKAVVEPVSTKILLDRAETDILAASRIPVEKNRTLGRIGLLRQQIGDKAGARAAFAKSAEVIVAAKLPISNGEWRELAKLQAQAGFIDDGLATAEHITSRLKDTTIREMARALAEGRLFREAMSFTDKRVGAEHRDLVYADVARLQAAAGDTAGALRTAALIRDEATLVYALLDNEYVHFGVAQKQAEFGDVEGARASIEKARKLCEKIGDKSESAFVWVSLAQTEARLGDFAAARRALAHCSDQADRVSNSPSLRDRGLQEIARAEAKAGKFDDSLRTAKTIGGVRPTVTAICAIAEANADAGRKESCNSALAEALRLAEEVSDARGERSGLYHIIATAQATVGDYEEAETTIKKEMSPDLTINNVVHIRALKGDFEGAVKTIDLIKRSQFWRGTMLRDIAMQQTSRGQEDAVLKRAEAEASPLLRAETLLGVVEARLATKAGVKK